MSYILIYLSCPDKFTKLISKKDLVSLKLIRTVVHKW
jgi:hypothetical protein